MTDDSAKTFFNYDKTKAYYLSMQSHLALPYMAALHQFQRSNPRLIQTCRKCGRFKDLDIFIENGNARIGFAHRCDGLPDMKGMWGLIAMAQLSKKGPRDELILPTPNHPPQKSPS